MRKQIYFLGMVALVLLMTGGLMPARAEAQFTIAFSDADFATNPQFSSVETFNFNLVVAAPLTTGVYNNPLLTSLDYAVNGVLAPGTPSGFPGFNLVRTIGGAEFYTQGSSLNFEIADTADLTDGLQASELVGAFELNAREDNTGRYHPALLVINRDGTGSIRNSDNQGGINPGSMREVDVMIGEEYVTNLSFSPSDLTISTNSVPEPSSAILCLLAIAGAAVRRRRA